MTGLLEQYSTKNGYGSSHSTIKLIVAGDPKTAFSLSAVRRGVAGDSSPNNRRSLQMWDLF